MQPKIKAAVIGSTGYGGVELIRLLLQHPNIQLHAVISTSSMGESIAESYPHLLQIAEMELDDLQIETLVEQVDIIFTATPSGVSGKLAKQLLEADGKAKIIDLSGDLRLQTPSLYEQWYGHESVDITTLKRAVYGLSELFEKQIQGATCIANPGCYPTASSLALAPLLSEKLIEPQSIIIDAKSGISGAGRKPNTTIHYAEINENIKPYKLNQHQHIPEIEQTLSQIAGEDITITFTTHLVPMTRGICSTIYAQLCENIEEAQLIEMYKAYYAGRKFIRIKPLGSIPSSKEVWGSNYCDIGFSVDKRTGRITIVAVIDNLVKGAAGQAIQNANIMMGWKETLGLDVFTPIYP
ncbi:N-acetyl-gamma-glutamyl-phosphate reductase [Longirhabdus pacifica]|uniref:N-acetyl-gamma-glutamyl-phosphate reductase n=1 Tax=Longirhabdus pacifica TaxID=2305227 RepID=UPI001F0C1F66|nr:N-acetyl-gamma-glutamyl-phosphate reductase [Longirhabdus pacifica]